MGRKTPIVTVFGFSAAGAGPEKQKIEDKVRNQINNFLTFIFYLLR